MEKKKPSGLALIPFLVFVAFYLISGIVLQMNGVEMAFYQIPSPISITLGIIVAFVMFKGTIDEKVNSFVSGCGDENIIIMCIIYLLAGAFAAVCKKIGAVDSVVNLFLTYIPVKFITAGVFIISVFLSTASGSSVGTILALGPIAFELSVKGDLNSALMLGALVGGAMAGDNLSLISDTTIAATRTQNVQNKDKFLMNFKIAIPAILLIFIIYLIAARPTSDVPLDIGTYNFLKIIPYLFVIIASLSGVNVFVVLMSGTIIASIIGGFYGAFDGLISLAQTIYEGFTSMTEIFLLSMLTGGLAHMVRQAGGIDWLILKIKKMIKGSRSVELAVASLVSLINLSVANNTVSIIIAGPIAKDLSNEYKVDPRKMASLLDIFSCIIQGIIPYGAQLLIASGFSEGKVSPVEIVPFAWYCFALAIFAIISTFLKFSNAKNEWDFENDRPMELASNK